MLAVAKTSVAFRSMWRRNELRVANNDAALSWRWKLTHSHRHVFGRNYEDINIFELSKALKCGPHVPPLILKKPCPPNIYFPLRRELQWKQNTSVRIAERCLQSLLMDSSFFELLYSTCADVLSSVPFLTREASAVATELKSCPATSGDSWPSAFSWSKMFSIELKLKVESITWWEENIFSQYYKIRAFQYSGSFLVSTCILFVAYLCSYSGAEYCLAFTRCSCQYIQFVVRIAVSERKEDEFYFIALTASQSLTW